MAMSWKGGELMSNLGERIVEYRAKHNMTQAEFAEAANLSTITILMIENDRHKPTRLTKAKIELVLKGD